MKKKLVSILLVSALAASALTDAAAVPERVSRPRQQTAAAEKQVIQKVIPQAQKVRKEAEKSRSLRLSLQFPERKLMMITRFSRLLLRRRVPSVRKHG